MREILLVGLFLCLSVHDCRRVKKDGLKIGAFNIRKFGIGKISNELNLQTIVKIVLRYDLIFIQEITDKTEEAIYTLLEKVNVKSSDSYRLSLSKRIGLEQYAYMYRSKKMNETKRIVYHDRKDVFAREPYIMIFETNALKSLERFAVIGVHTRPTDARDEIDSLEDVYKYVKSTKWRETDVIIMGDLNADCGYFPKVAKKKNRVYNDGTNTKATYKWVIGDEVDTTVGKTTDCAYDRFILAGRDMKKSYVEESAKTFDFQKVYGLDDYEAKNVSDHYPIEMKLA